MPAPITFEQGLITLRDKKTRSTIPAKKRAAFAEQRLSVAEDAVEEVAAVVKNIQQQCGDPERIAREEKLLSYWGSERDIFREVLSEAQVELARGETVTPAAGPASGDQTITNEELRTLSADNNTLRARNDSLGTELQQLRDSSRSELDRVSSEMQATIESLNTRIAELESGEAVSAANTAAATARAEAVQANKNIERLESLCGFRGINLKEVVPAVPNNSLLTGRNGNSHRVGSAQIVQLIRDGQPVPADEQIIQYAKSRKTQ